MVLAYFCQALLPLLNPLLALIVGCPVLSRMAQQEQRCGSQMRWLCQLSVREAEPGGRGEPAVTGGQQHTRFAGKIPGDRHQTVGNDST